MTNGRFIQGSFLARSAWLLAVLAVIFLSACTGAFAAQDKAGPSGEKVNVFVAQDAIGGLKEQADKIGTVTFAKPGLKLGELKGDNIVALRLTNKSMADHLADQKIKVDAKWLGEQGFQIITTNRPAGNLIAITANTDAGLYYGILELTGKLSGAKKIEELSVNMKDRPVFELRAGAPEDRGNIVFVDGKWAFDLRKFPECFGGDKNLEEKINRGIAERRKELRATLDRAGRYGQQVFVHTYEASIPLTLEIRELRNNFLRTHPEARSSLYNYKITLCPSADITRKFVYERYRELFASFPDLAGVRLTLGDCGGNLECECDRCKKYPFQQRVVDYASLILKAIRESNPKAQVMLRSWFISRRCDFVALQDQLPEGVFYCSKLTSPPGNDNLWKDQFSPYVGKIRRFAALAVGSCETDEGIPHFLYDGFRHKRRCERLARAGAIGIPGSSDWWDSRSFAELPGKARFVCAWNPFRFDPEAFLKEWSAEKFGPEAGRCVYLALRDTEKIVDDLILKDQRCGSFHMYNFFPWRDAPEKQNHHPPYAQAKWRRVYGGPMTGQPREIYEVTTDTLKKLEEQMSYSRALSIAKEACRQMDAARKMRPDDKDIRRLGEMAHTELALVEFLRDYHLALLYYNLACNEPARFKEMRPRIERHLEAAKEKVSVYESGIREIIGKPLSETKNTLVYIASMTQQLRNAYDEIVVAGEPEQGYEGIWHLANHRKGPSLDEQWGPTKKRLQKNWASYGGKADFIVIADSNRNPPEVVAPDILPEITITFKNDIPQDALVRIVFEPLGSAYIHRRAEIDVILDGVKLGRIEQSAQKWTMWGEPRFLRCFKVAAPRGGATHKLTLRATGGTGIYLRQISLEKPAGPASRPAATSSRTSVP